MGKFGEIYIELQERNITLPHTLEYKEYCATLYPDMGIEFLYADEVDGYRQAKSFQEFEEMAIAWMKTGELPKE